MTRVQNGVKQFRKRKSKLEALNVTPHAVQRIFNSTWREYHLTAHQQSDDNSVSNSEVYIGL